MEYCKPYSHFNIVNVFYFVPGEEIKVYNKQADGWWQGELNGRVGIFPATYVKDC